MKAKKDINYDYVVDILKGILATVVIDDFVPDSKDSSIAKDYQTSVERMKNDLLTYSICQVLSELGHDPVQACIEAIGKVYNLIQHKARQDTTSTFFDMPEEFKKDVAQIDTSPVTVDRLVKLYNDNFKELYADDDEEK